MRVALYYAPTPDDPLWAAGASWLALPDIAAITADARRYGLHATLKPPMRLREGTTLAQLQAAATTLLQDFPTFDLPPLAVADLHGFLALRETVPCPALHALADRCVEGVDSFRAPPDAAELARRRSRPLSPEREAMLQRWGYPDVFKTWYFHMTLTRRLTPAERVWLEPAAAAHLAAANRPRRVTDVCLFVEDQPGATFRLAARVPLQVTAAENPGPTDSAPRYHS